MAQHYDFLSSDIFFKFALVSDDEDSRFLLHTIIESVLEIKVNSFKVLNPEIISMFKNGLSDDIIGTGKVVEAMKNKCEEFTESDLKDYYEDAFERARLSHLGDIKVAKREGKAEGLAEGLNEGKRTALIEAIKAFITSRYPNNDLSFLENLDEDQLKELLLKSPTITLEELKKYQ